MTDRRDFLKTSLGVTLGVVGMSATPVLAAGHASFTKGVIFTKANPGKWVEKVGGHFPMVTADGRKVTIETKHSMSEKHYIVRHTLVSGNGEVLGAKTFAPTDAKAISVYEVPEGHSILYATSFCNLHDLWLAEITI
jgi:superoxide reductase